MRSMPRRVLYLATVVAVTAAAMLCLEPKPAETSLYSAGSLRPNTNICRCPKLAGDCVCEWETY